MTTALLVVDMQNAFCHPNVESTTRSGYMRDYRMTVVADCVTAQTQRLHENALEAMEAGRFARVAPPDEIAELTLDIAAWRLTEVSRQNQPARSRSARAP